MTSRWWIIGSVGVMTTTVLLCLWVLFVDRYARLFIDVAVAQFIC